MTSHTSQANRTVRRWWKWALAGVLALLTLAVLVSLVIQATGRRAIERQIEALRDAGEPTTAGEFAALYPQPQGRNAADLFRRAGEKFIHPRDIDIPAAFGDLIDDERQRHEARQAELQRRREEARQQQRQRIERPMPNDADDPHWEVIPAPSHPPPGGHWSPHGGDEDWHEPETLADLLPVIGRVGRPDDFQQPPSDLTLKAIEVYLDRNAEAIELLMEGAALDSAWSPSTIVDGLDATENYARTVRGLPRLMMLRAHLAAARGDSAAVTESILAVFALASAFEHHADPIEMAVHAWLRTRMAEQMQWLLNYPLVWEERELERIERSLASLADKELFLRAMRTERVYMLQQIGTGAAYEEVLVLWRWLGVLPHNVALTLRYIGRICEAAQLPAHERLDRVVAIAEEAADLPWQYQVTAYLVPGYEALLRTDNIAVASDRVMTVVLAIERYRLAHGRPPDALSDLVPDWIDAVPLDPFDGQTLRYRPLEPGYVVYSVGPDGEDGGGRRTGQPDGDIVISVQR